jgi:hypothetical protein
VHNRRARPSMRYVRLRGRTLLLPRASVSLGISSRSRWLSAPLSLNLLADTATAGTSHRKDADST